MSFESWQVERAVEDRRAAAEPRPRRGRGWHRVQRAVWEVAHVKGSALLVLLAIAWHADDRGVAHPSVGLLALECRMERRQVGRILAKLEAEGELKVERRAGPNATHRFTILTRLPE